MTHIEPIKDTKYGITKQGIVWKLEGNKNWKGQTPPYIVDPTDNGDGYKIVNLHGKIYYVHRLVAEYYLQNPNRLKYVGHRDHNKSNNCVDNLYWTEASDNTKDGIKDGRINYKGRLKSKMSYHTDQILCEAYKSVKVGESIQNTSNIFNINRTTLSSWINKRSRQGLTDLIDLELDDIKKLRSRLFQKDLTQTNINMLQ